MLLVIFFPLMKLSGYPLELKHTMLLTWGALRGALGIFLSLILVNSSKEENPLVREQTAIICLFHTSFIALFTLLINGLTTGKLVHALDLSKEEEIEKKFMWMYATRLQKESEKFQQEFETRCREN